jgi:tetratricopeptide (TPR) repeat protein
MMVNSERLIERGRMDHPPHAPIRNLPKPNWRECYVQALNGRADALYMIGSFKKATVDYERVLKESNVFRVHITALSGLVKICNQSGAYDQALRQADKMMHIASTSKDRLLRGRALMCKASALQSKGAYRQSLAVTDQALRCLHSIRKHAARRRDRAENIRTDIANCFNIKGMVYNEMGQYSQAVDHFRKCLRIVEKMENQVGTINAPNNIALVHWREQKFEASKELFAQALSIANTIGYKYGLSVILGNIALVSNELGKVKESIKCSTQAKQLAEEIGDIASTGIHSNNIGIAYERSGDLELALQYYKYSISVFEKVGYIFGTAMVANNIAVIHCDQGDHDKAFVWMERAERIAIDADLAEILIRCTTVKGRIYKGWHKWSRSLAAFRKALELSRKYRMDDLMLDATVEYLNAALLRAECTGVPLEQEATRCLSKMLRVSQNKAMDNGIRIQVVLVLMRADLHTKDYRKAEEKFLLLRKLLRKNHNKMVIAETLYIKARLASAMGKKDYKRHLAESIKYSQGIGYGALLKEIRLLESLAAKVDNPVKSE